LKLFGVDLDVVAKKYKRSQKFNLVDVSAVFLAGPVGLAVTKGSDYANLLISKKGDSTLVHEFVSDWRLHAGLLKAHDVAFSTNQNRIAVHGSINLWSQTFEELNFALVNEQGCAVFQQEVRGRFVDPEVSNVRVVKTLIGPLRNIFTGKKCKHPFYTGSVQHPVAN
jgi:AsmA protein